MLSALQIIQASIQFFPSRTVALSIGMWDVHWYGVMYALAFFLGIMLLPKLEKYRGILLSEHERNALITNVILGVLLGGRLGYVLLYDPRFYWLHPMEIPAVWHGGMSSHGGMVGVTIGLFFFSRRYHVDIWKLADILVVPVAIGLGLGRLGNFINGELYGTITSLPWAMHFPEAQGLRHPTQLYAIAKDTTIAIVCFLFLRKTAPVFSYTLGQKTIKAGRVAALFFMMYGVLRFTIEYVREQPFDYYHIGSATISYGQLYTIPVIVLGIVLWKMRQSKEQEEVHYGKNL